MRFAVAHDRLHWAVALSNNAMLCLDVKDWLEMVKQVCNIFGLADGGYQIQTSTDMDGIQS